MTLPDLPEINDRDWFSWDGVLRIKDDIRAKIRRECPEMSGLQVELGTQNLFQKALQAKPTYSERQKAWRLRQTQGAASLSITLTDEQIEYLTFLLEGSNNPIGQEILRRLIEEMD